MKNIGKTKKRFWKKKKAGRKLNQKQNQMMPKEKKMKEKRKIHGTKTARKRGD